MVDELLFNYKKKKSAIRKRLREFRSGWERSEKEIFSELCFCICTPQSKAVYCDKAISRLKKSGMLYKGDLSQIRAGLTAVRFPNNKSRYILAARDLFSKNGVIKVKDKINTKDILGSRDWIFRNVKGLGLKEASHFLRNIGFGQDLAILDVHIFKNMVRYGLISERPKTLSAKNYLLLEDKIRGFAKDIKIPMDELDLLFWSAETGEIFK